MSHGRSHSCNSIMKFPRTDNKSLSVRITPRAKANDRKAEGSHFIISPIYKDC